MGLDVNDDAHRGVLVLDVDDQQVRRAIASHDGELISVTAPNLGAVFASAGQALQATLALREEGLLISARAGVSVAPSRSVEVARGQAQAMARLARRGHILCAASALAAAAGVALPGEVERIFLTLSELSGPELVIDVPPRRAEHIAPVAAFPLPGPLAAAATTGLFGRDAELDHLRVAWTQAVEGTRTAIVVRGEIGMGKTHLVSAFAREVHTSGGLVLSGQFDEDSGSAHHPFVDALRFYLERVPAALLAERLGADAGELSRLVPDLTSVLGPPRLVPGDGELEQHRLAEALDDWLSEAAQPAGLVFVFDDMQWASPESIRLISHIVRSKRPARLLVVLVVRDEPEADRRSVTRLLGTKVDEIELEGLAGDAVSEIAAVHLGGARGRVRALAPTLSSVTAGNPLFVVQLLHHLRESGVWPASIRDDDALVERVGLPADVREVLDRRVLHLGEHGVHVLERAALMRTPFELDIVETVADLGPSVVADVAEQATERGLLRSLGDRRYEFAHSLVRVALVDRLGPTRRTRLHTRIADAIEARYADDLDAHVDVLAHHLARAGRNDPRTVDYTRRAGWQALNRLAYDDAAGLFSTAAQRLPKDSPPELRDEILLGLGTAQQLRGDVAAAETLLDVGRSAAARGDTGSLVRAALASSRGFFGRLGSVDERRAELLELALQHHVEPDVERARLLARLGHENSFAGDAERHRAIVTEGLAIARQCGGGEVLADALTSAHNTFFEPGRTQERLAMMKELFELAETSGDTVVRMRARWFYSEALAEAGELAAARRACAEAIELAEQTGQPVAKWATRVLWVGYLATACQLDEAEAEATAVHTLGLRAGQPDATLFYGGQLFHLRYEQDRLDELVPLFFPFADDPDVLPMISAMAAVFDLLLGNDLAARRRIASVIDRGLDHLGRDELYLPTLAMLGESVHRLGDVRAAGEVDALLEPYTDSLVIIAAGAIGLSGSVAYHRGRLRRALGDEEGAFALYDAALARHEQVGAQAWILRTRLAQAEARAVRDPVAAGALARRVAADAEPLGLVAIASRAAALAAATD